MALDSGVVVKLIRTLRQGCEGILDPLREIILFAKKEGRQAGRDLGQAHWDLENAAYDDCIEKAERARQVYDRHRLWHSVLLCQIVLCKAYAHLGQSEEIRKQCLSATEILDKSREGMDRAFCYMAISEVYSSAGLFVEALQFLKLARNIHKGKVLLSGVALCELEMANVCLAMGNYDDAETLFLTARHAFALKKDFGHTSSCNSGLALVYIQTGEYDKGRECSAASTNDIRKYKKSLSFYFGRAIRRKLTRDYDKGLGISSRQGDLLTSGMVAFAEGKFADAELAFGGAIESIEKTRAKLANNDHRISFLEISHNSYHIMIEVCLRRNKHREALEYVERLKTRSLVERLAVQGQEVQERPSRSAGRAMTKRSDETSVDRILDAEHMSYEEIKQVAAQAADALVYLFPTTHKTVMFVVFGDKMKADQVEISYDFDDLRLMAHVAKLRSSARNTSKEQLRLSIHNLLEDLGKKALLKVIPYLDGLWRVVMVPFGGFHLVPLHAASIDEGGNGKCLLDKHLITYAPSAKVLRACLRKQPPEIDNVAVFFSDTDSHRKLFHGSRESDAVARLFGTDPIRKASVADFREKGKNAHVIHYSGHAAGESLVLHRPDDPSQRDEYSVPDIFNSLDLPRATLVTLSACDTGQVRLGKADEYIGLPSAFLHAGAATVVCSLWPVSDASTSLLMGKMYGQIRKGAGKAAALRDAQLWLRDSTRQEREALAEEMGIGIANGQGTKGRKSSGFIRESVNVAKVLPADTSHPYYWAGFICSGAP